MMKYEVSDNIDYYLINPKTVLKLYYRLFCLSGSLWADFVILTNSNSLSIFNFQFDETSSYKH